MLEMMPILLSHPFVVFGQVTKIEIINVSLNTVITNHPHRRISDVAKYSYTTSSWNTVNNEFKEVLKSIVICPRYT